MTTFEPVIGFEVYAELMTQSKMFCGCPVVDSTSAEPNTAVCEICTGMPGTLPVINARAVQLAIRVAVALHCEVAETSVFARKNYFYPDLPKGYQISQYELPLATDGWITISTPDGEKRIRIRRVHLEEDTGKLFHRDGYSLIDYNRSGVPLLEIVSEPDIRSVEEAKAYAESLRTLLRYLEVNSGDMEKGVIRFEANISLRPKNSKTFGTRTEVKNLNSFKAMAHAVAYEIERQSEILQQGGQIVQETLGWDEVRNKTISQRSKEEAHDYRYFPEPDLPPLHVEPTWIDQIRDELPELPHAKRKRFMQAYKLTPYITDLLTDDHLIADFFEQTVDHAPELPAVKVANWLTGEFFSLLNQSEMEIQDCSVSPQSFAALVSMVERGDITAASGKQVLGEMFVSGGTPTEIVKASGLAQLDDIQAIDHLVEEVLQSNPQQLEQYLAGKTTLSQWFIGQIMQATEGRADPTLVRESLQKSLRAIEDSRQTKP